MFGWIPRITKETLPESGNSVAIYADCTGSMRFADSFPNMVEAVNAVWPIANARLFGYSDDACDIYEVSSPHQLECTDHGTCFGPMLRHAEHINADMTLIFSDGIPSDEDEMWRVWHATSFPIATHLCLPLHWLDENQASVEVMQKLCRGGGKFTCGDTVAELNMGVVQAMAKEPIPYVATARRLPDVSQQVLTGVQAAKNHAAINDRVVELGDEVSEAKADIFELQERQIIADAFHQTVSGLDGKAVEAIGVQRARDCVDKATQQAAKADLTGGLLRLSAGILGAIGVSLENRLAHSEAARHAPHDNAAAPRIEHQGLDLGMLNRVGAIAAARAVKDAALPPPTREAVALPSSPASNTRSNGRAALAPPSTASTCSRTKEREALLLPAPSPKPSPARSTYRTPTAQELAAVVVIKRPRP